MEDDVYSFGLILLQSLIGPSFSLRNETFLLNEMVLKTDLMYSIRVICVERPQNLTLGTESLRVFIAENLFLLACLAKLKFTF